MKDNRISIKINQIFSVFGVMKINRAETLGVSLHEHYVRCVQTGVKEDFGVLPRPNVLEDSRKWWRENFRRMVDRYEDNLVISNEPEFEGNRDEREC